ncbi:MAG: hypothetical protein KJO40_19540 [Deltaproteobacteria bacterium]|nr:hypothetical protein [Deltaproteobacteria bacterium]
MSFRCQFCGEAQPAGTPPVRMVTRVRQREYGLSTFGWEIAEEKNACEVCKDRIALDATPPELKLRPGVTLAERAGAQLADLYRDFFRDPDLQTGDVQ